MTGVPLLTRKAPGLPDGDCVSPRCRGPEQYLEHNAAGRTRPGTFTGIFAGILAADPRGGSRLGSSLCRPNTRLAGDLPLLAALLML
jgi:hypothetical protein